MGGAKTFSYGDQTILAVKSKWFARVSESFSMSVQKFCQGFSYCYMQATISRAILSCLLRKRSCLIMENIDIFKKTN